MRFLEFPSRRYHKNAWRGMHHRRSGNQEWDGIDIFSEWQQGTKAIKQGIAEEEADGYDPSASSSAEYEDTPFHNRRYVKQQNGEGEPCGRPCSERSRTHSLEMRDNHNECWWWEEHHDGRDKRSIKTTGNQLFCSVLHIPKLGSRKKRLRHLCNKEF